MKPGKYDLSIYRGDTYGWRFRLWQDEAHTVPMDLTGAEAKAEIRDKSGGTLLAELACTITAPNTVDAAMPHTVSQGLTKGGLWDLQITFPGDVVQTVVAGSVTATGDITDSVVVGTMAARR